MRLYHASRKDELPLSINDARQITSKINVTLNEMKVLTDKPVRLNYQAMYEQILHNDKDTWKAVAYLEKLKAEMHGFDFKIHYNNDGLPDAIVFMTHGMRRNLIRFGDILFLDSSKRQLNKIGWPYIGPAVMTNEWRVRTVSEAVVLSESIAMYTWILQAMAVMEPRWQPTNIRLIFADGLITKRLLINLGINDKCLLHGDFYHLFSEV